MKKKIAIIGAFDRYNYGDLLFPILLEKEFETYRDQFDLEYYALLKSDLSNYGAKITKDFGDLFSEELPEGSIVVIAGGDVIGAEWITMHQYLQDGLDVLFLRFMRKYARLYKQIDRNLAKRYQSRSDMPWILSKKMFKNNVKVIFNSVGGSNLKVLRSYYQNYLKENLSDVDYLSVREEDTKSGLKNIGIENEIFVSPDSAVIMSEYFPKEFLRDQVRKEIKNLDENYICFQIKKEYGLKNIETLVDQLDKIYDHYGFRVLLLPIGTAYGHEDHIALKAIKERIKNAEMFDDLTIFEVMYLIANSKGYIGTSLHGAITSISFEVPYLGLVEDISKLKSFLEKWAVDLYKGGVGYDGIFDGINKFINPPKVQLCEKKNEMIGLVRQNYLRIKQIIL
jgi:hypothetical protein